jgi:hypothetical protein
MLYRKSYAFSILAACALLLAAPDFAMAHDGGLLIILFVSTWITVIFLGLVVCMGYLIQSVYGKLKTKVSAWRITAIALLSSLILAALAIWITLIFKLWNKF